MNSRGFEIVDEWARKHQKSVILPIRGTKYSAGYDFVLYDDIEVPKNNNIFIWTDIKAYMQTDEVLKIYIRSSLAIKKGLYLSNYVGIIDHDYYGNPKNDGNIGVSIENKNPFPVMLYKGDKIVQGIFEKYLISFHTDINNGTFDKTRNGGIGSTN